MDVTDSGHGYPQMPGINDFDEPEARPTPVEPPPWCQHCWADPRYTKITDDKERRCPVCGADYTGPRRPSLTEFFAGSLFKDEPDQ